MSSWDVTSGWDDAVANDQYGPLTTDEDDLGLQGSDSTSVSPQAANRTLGAFLTPPVCVITSLKS